MRILREDSVCVVVDIQEKLLPHIFEGDRTMRNCLKLIAGMKILSVPILVTQQYTKGLGPTVSPVIEEIGQINLIEKIAFSCCDEPHFMAELNMSGSRSVILCGIETHVCVLQTCLDLLADGKFPVVVEDCVSSRKPQDKDVAIQRMRKEGALITTAESILFELTRSAGTSVFKAISGIVK